MLRFDIELDEMGTMVEADDMTFGYYAHAGIMFDFGGLTIGLDYRIVREADISIDGETADLDYDQLSFVLGFTL